MKCKECNGKGTIPMLCMPFPEDELCPSCKGSGLEKTSEGPKYSKRAHTINYDEVPWSYP